MKEWFYDHYGLTGLGIILIIVVFIGSITALLVYVDSSHRSVFMTECRQDHKQYECDVLWGRAQGEGFTPIPIIIPMGR